VNPETTLSHPDLESAALRLAAAYRRGSEPGPERIAAMVDTLLAFTEIHPNLPPDSRLRLVQAAYDLLGYPVEPSDAEQPFAIGPVVRAGQDRILAITLDILRRVQEYDDDAAVTVANGVVRINQAIERRRQLELASGED
jgi:hypothetical protein